MQTTSPLPPPPPSSRGGSPPPRRLYRAPAGERIIGGVAAGLADFLAVSTGLARFAFVALSLVGGLGVLLYIGGLLLMPERPQGVPSSAVPPRGPALDSAGQVVGAILIVLAASIMLDGIGIGTPEVVWSLGLIALGLVLFRRADALPSRSEPSSPATTAPPGGTPAAAPGSPPGPPPAAPGGDPGPGYRGPGGAPSAPVATQPTAVIRPRSPRRRRPRSPLGRITVALAFVAAGLLTGADQLELVSVGPAEVLAVVLLVLGLGLLVGSIFGRARILILPVLLLVPVVLAAGAASVGGSLTAGERRSAPTGAVTGPLDYALGMGTLQVDLSDADLQGRVVDVSAEIGLGELVVTVPPEVEVEADARVLAGKINLLGQRRDGVGLRRSSTDPGDPSEGTLRLTTRAGLGEISVRRASDAGTDVSARQRDLVPASRAAHRLARTLSTLEDPR